MSKVFKFKKGDQVRVKATTKQFKNNMGIRTLTCQKAILRDTHTIVETIIEDSLAYELNSGWRIPEEFIFLEGEDNNNDYESLSIKDLQFVYKDPIDGGYYHVGCIDFVNNEFDYLPAYEIEGGNVQVVKGIEKIEIRKGVK